MHTVNATPITLGALEALVEALQELKKHGVVVQSFQLEFPRPSIRILPPPVDGFLRGVVYSKTVIGNARLLMFAAPFHGCQVEWKVEEAIEPMKKDAHA